MTELIIIIFFSLLFARASVFFFIRIKQDLGEDVLTAQKEFYQLISIFAWPWYASYVLLKLTNKDCHSNAVSLLLAFCAYWAIIVATLLLGQNISPLLTLLGGGAIFITWAAAAFIAILAVDNASVWKILD